MRFTRAHIPWFKGITLGLSLLAVTLPVFAANPAELVDVEANGASKRIVFKMSEPVRASFLSPYDQGERKLFIDIVGATAETLANKDSLIQQVKGALPGVTNVAIYEFRGPQPLVRIAITTAEPNITGSLVQNHGETLVLQLVRQDNFDPVPKKQTQLQKSDPQPTRVQSGKPTFTSNRKRWAKRREEKRRLKASVNHMETQLDRQVYESDTLRHERDVYEDDTERLKRLVLEQNKLIAHLKNEQERLLKLDPKARERDRIRELQRELRELENSYKQLRRDNERHLQANAKLRYDLKRQVERNLEVDAILEEQKFKIPGPGGEARGGLLNTLNTLTQAELEKLVTAEEHFRKGKKYELQGDEDSAITQYKTAITYAPQVNDYATTLGALYLKKREYEQARYLLESALRFHPNDPTLLNELGKAALLLNDEIAAVNYFRQAIDSAVLSNYASTLRRDNKWDEAEATYQVAISANPEDSDLQYNLGTLYIAQKRFVDARDRFIEAIKLNPQFGEAYYHLGLTYAELGRARDAIAQFQKYLMLFPDAPNRSIVEKYIKDLNATQYRRP